MAADEKISHRSLVDAGLLRLAGKIAPLVQAQLSSILVSELEKHLSEKLLADLQTRVEVIAERELKYGIQHVLDLELSRRAEEIISRELLTKLEDAVDRVLRPKLSESLLWSHLFQPNDLFDASEHHEYMAVSNSIAKDFLHPEFKEFCRLYHHERHRPIEMHRKMWEWAFIYHKIRRAGFLRPGTRGLGFGVGTERLPSFLANFGSTIVATDAPTSTSWDKLETADRIFYPDLVTEEAFKERVSFALCDMNEIPDHLTGFDFCWSSCALEHLGSLQRGLDFIVSSVEKTLKVGGVACHTTELNLSSNEETIETEWAVYYRRKDLDELIQVLQERGHHVEPLRIEPGGLVPDYLVDLPPHKQHYHLKLLVGKYVTTSVGIVVRRGV